MNCRNKLNQAQVNLMLGRRAFVFLDEWLSYASLYYLYTNEEYQILGGALPFALLLNGVGYHCLWKLCNQFDIP